jgi:hypothetical protein
MNGGKNVAVTISVATSALALVALVVLQIIGRLETTHYEYKVVTVASEGHDRTGENAMKFASVTPKDDELTALGADGWEVVGMYLEMETAFPNFGKAEYVTGLQTNTRPQRAVIILRRRA